MLDRTAAFPASALLLVFAACSNLPPPAYPRYVEVDVEAHFVVGPDGRLDLPVSDRRLVVRELLLEPAPLDEHHEAGARWFVYTAGTHVRARCRMRSYADGDRVPLGAEAIFPGATRITQAAPRAATGGPIDAE
jgi:hypothetical protein